MVDWRASAGVSPNTTSLRLFHKRKNRSQRKQMTFVFQLKKGGIELRLEIVELANSQAIESTSYRRVPQSPTSIATSSRCGKCCSGKEES
jgi:hypothetical protein